MKVMMMWSNRNIDMRCVFINRLNVCNNIIIISCGTIRYYYRHHFKVRYETRNRIHIDDDNDDDDNENNHT